MDNDQGRVRTCALGQAEDTLGGSIPIEEGDGLLGMRGGGKGSEQNRPCAEEETNRSQSVPGNIRLDWSRMEAVASAGALP